MEAKGIAKKKDEGICRCICGDSQAYSMLQQNEEFNLLVPESLVRKWNHRLLTEK